MMLPGSTSGFEGRGGGSRLRAGAALTVKTLLRMGPDELNALYQQCPVGPVPSGKVRGHVLVRPGSTLAPLMSKGARMLWQGKIFRDDGTAINRFFGLRMIRARIDQGSSWMDGGPALILDYQHTSRIYAKYRDEIRQVAPGLYLGVMYDRTTPCPAIKLYFALETVCH